MAPVHIQVCSFDTAIVFCYFFVLIVKACFRMQSFVGQLVILFGSLTEKCMGNSDRNRHHPSLFDSLCYSWRTPTATLLVQIHPHILDNTLSLLIHSALNLLQSAEQAVVTASPHRFCLWISIGCTEPGGKYQIPSPHTSSSFYSDHLLSI